MLDHPANQRAAHRCIGELHPIGGAIGDRRASDDDILVPDIARDVDGLLVSREEPAVDLDIATAAEHKAATEVHLRGEKVFERRDGEWYFTG